MRTKAQHEASLFQHNISQPALELWETTLAEAEELPL